MSILSTVRDYFGFGHEPRPEDQSGFTQLLLMTNQLEDLADTLWKSRRAHQAEHIRQRAELHALLDGIAARIQKLTDERDEATDREKSGNIREVGALASVALAIRLNVLDDPSWPMH